MFEKFAASTREAVRAGAEEAQRRGDRRIGTDHLLLGLLHDPASADVLGITVADGREKSADLDRRALAAIGIDLDGYVPAPKLRRVFRTTFRTDVAADGRGEVQENCPETPAARPARAATARPGGDPARRTRGGSSRGGAAVGVMTAS